MQFTEQEWLRYTRHIQLPSIGASGQARLKQAKILIVGCGGLGSPVSLYLAAAGIGELTLVDGDVVDITNLQRQILFDSDQVGRNKAQCGKQKLNALNPDINVTAVEQPLTFENAKELISTTDLVLDCTDNFSTRYLINDMCAELNKPWIFASIHQFSGQCALFTPESACFRCLFPESPTDIPDCNAAGVLGVLPGMLGMFQANEALKFLTGLSTPLDNTLLLIEAIDLTFRKIKLAKSPDCIICNHHQSPSTLTNFYQTLCTNDESLDFELTAVEFDKLRNDNDYQVLDVRTESERAAFHLGGAHKPLSELASYIQDISKEKVLLCYCQSGLRSAKAVLELQKFGLQGKSLKGGITEWLKHQS